MLFNSIDFAIFLPIFFLLYWGLSSKNVKLQNILIVFASYFFYAWWDWRFLFLIFLSTLVDYTVGNKLYQEGNWFKRKILLWTSIIINIGSLLFFKYCNFFLESFTTAFSFLGTKIQVNHVEIILPVGISFYTFQTLSYTIDIYRKKIEPTKDFISFTTFVSFFPQLVAGPIEKAGNLLPKFTQKRVFEYSKVTDGMRQILWGLFKKIVIADNCARYANFAFNDSIDHSGSSLVLGAIFFSFQIYGDFSGYSDIAIGTAKLFGIQLTQNFASPYFSRNIREFWRRWHISLNTWFKEYIYIPLGGNQGCIWMQIKNIFILFIISGFWHGANWTFIVWGALNAIYFLPSVWKKQIKKMSKESPSLKDFWSIIYTFSLITFAWIFFRAESINHAIKYISTIFSKSIFSLPSLGNTTMILFSILFVIFLIFIEWMGREQEYGIQFLAKKSRIFSWSFYYSLIIFIFLFACSSKPFIYFQF